MDATRVTKSLRQLEGPNRQRWGTYVMAGAVEPRVSMVNRGYEARFAVETAEAALAASTDSRPVSAPSQRPRGGGSARSSARGMARPAPVLFFKYLDQQLESGGKGRGGPPEAGTTAERAAKAAQEGEAAAGRAGSGGKAAASTLKSARELGELAKSSRAAMLAAVAAMAAARAVSD